MPCSGEEAKASSPEFQYWARPVPWALAIWLATKSLAGDSAALAGGLVSASNRVTGFDSAVAPGHHQGGERDGADPGRAG